MVKLASWSWQKNLRNGMNSAELLERVGERTGYTPVHVAEILNEVCTLVAEVTAKAEPVMIPGFGKFEPCFAEDGIHFDVTFVPYAAYRAILAGKGNAVIECRRDLKGPVASVRLGMLRLHHLLWERADQDGHLQLSVVQLSRDLGCAAETLHVRLHELADEGRILNTGRLRQRCYIYTVADPEHYKADDPTTHAAANTRPIEMSRMQARPVTKSRQIAWG